MAVNRLCMVAQMGQSWKVGKKQFPWQPVLDSCRWWPSPISLPSFSLFLDMFAFFQSPHHQRKHNAVSAAYRGDRPVQPSRGWTPSAPGAALAEPYKMNPCRTPWKCCLGAMSTHGRCGPRLILSSLIGSGSVMDHILIGLHVVTRGTLTAARQQHQRLRKTYGVLMMLTWPPIPPPNTWIQSSTVGHHGGCGCCQVNHWGSRSWLTRSARAGRSIPSVLSSGPPTDALVFSYSRTQRPQTQRRRAVSKKVRKGSSSMSRHVLVCLVLP